MTAAVLLLFPLFKIAATIVNMEILFFVLIAIGAIAVLWFIVRRLGGCILRLLITLAVVALAGYLIFYLVTR